MQNHNVPLDFFSWHLYNNDITNFGVAAAYYREQLDRRGYTATESHITEWNTETNESTGRDAAVALRVGAQGATLMTAAWIGLQEQEVDVSMFFRGTDPAMDNPTFYGIFFANGQPKKMALAFSLWSQLAAHPSRMNITTTGGNASSPLWVLAGENAVGEIALLIANPHDIPTSWQAIFPLSEGIAQVTVQQVSDDQETVQTFTLSEPVTEIGAYTVQLVTIEP
ncbi:MAG: hypothetical protein U9Q70_06035 [Chloroflexota bacterium]|nr:hypothetical protein [Chloroflexota bacterium]